MVVRALLPRIRRRTTMRSEVLEELQLRTSAAVVLSSVTLRSAGGVASYARPTSLTALLPARSRQPPLITAAPLSGPRYVFALHEATPEVASVPLQRISTGWLY